VLQLDILSSPAAGTSIKASHFPFRLGRSPGSQLRLEEPGVWDDHAEIQLRDQRFVLQILPNATALVNGVAPPQSLVPLANGDIITLGSVQIRFGLGAVRQKALLPREFIAWTILAAIVLAQGALIVWLLR
jgi:predicted component of type VI protein secretion system